MATAVPAIAASVTAIVATNTHGCSIVTVVPKTRRATSHASPNETMPIIVVALILPSTTAANEDGAATSISIVPFQRSIVIVQPELKSASHQSAMKTGAIAA